MNRSHPGPAIAAVVLGRHGVRVATSGGTLATCVNRWKTGIDVMVRGLRRVRTESLEIAGDVLEAHVASIEDESLASDDTLVREYAARVALIAWGLPKRATLEAIGAVHGPGRLADVVIGPARLSLEARLELLEELRPAARVGRVLRDAEEWTFSTLASESWASRLYRRLWSR